MTTSAKELLEKYKLGTCSAQEKLLVEDWFMKYGTDDNVIVSLVDVDRIKKEMWQVVQANRNRKRKLWPRIGIAAAVAAIAFGIWFYTSRHLEGSEATRDLLNYANDIPPGGNRATLTANGKTINLSNDHVGLAVDAKTLAYNDGTAIDPSALGMTDGESRTLEVITPRGGMYVVSLQDGTKIWLNNGSKLEFLSDYRNKLQRIVKLTGEAYFEVAKNKRQPFLVESNGQRVEVLGTHFNISAYKGEGIKTTLLEGSVKVASLVPPGRGAAGGEGQVVLKPNQQSLITGNSAIVVKEVDPAMAVAWKNGNFMFEQESIEQIMNKVARWYDVDIVYQGPKPTQKYNGITSRAKNVSQLLGILESTGTVHFKIEGKNIIVIK